MHAGVCVQVCFGRGRVAVLLSSPVAAWIGNLSKAKEKVQSIQVLVIFEYSRTLESFTYYYSYVTGSEFPSSACNSRVTIEYHII